LIARGEHKEPEIDELEQVCYRTIPLERIVL